MREVIEVHDVFGHEVDAPETSVGVRRGEGHERVGEVVGGDDVREARGEERRCAEAAIPVAEDALHDHHREVVGRAPANALHGDSDVGSGDFVVADANFRADEGRFGVGQAPEGDGGGRDGERGEVLLGELDELCVLDAAGSDENHAVGGVVGLDVRGEVVPLDGEDVRLGTEDGATEGLALEGDGVEVVEDDLLELLVDLLLLAEDYVALALDGGGLELGVLEDVGDDVDGGGDVLAEALGVVDGLLARGVGVEVRANILDFELERVLCAPAGALEGHVLQEVGGPVRLVRLGPRACVYPHTDRCCLRMRLRLSGDCEAIGQRRDLGEGARDVVCCRKSPQRPLLSSISLLSL